MAVALGVGAAVASTPAVALAAPDDSGSRSSGASSSDKSSDKSSAKAGPRKRDRGSLNSRGEASRDSGSASSDKSSDNSSAKAGPRKRDRGSLNPRAEVAKGAPGEVAAADSTTSTGQASAPAKLERRGTDADGATFRPWSRNVSTKTSPKPTIVVTPPAADPPASLGNFVDVRDVAVEARSRVEAPATAPPTDPVDRVVSTLVNAVLSPFADSTPTAPVQSPAAWTLAAFARREFEQAVSSPSTITNPFAGQTTTGLVTSAVEPGFVSSTIDLFGLIKITSAGDPEDDNYVAVVVETPFFTNVLTSGTDPEDNLGFGAASIGVPGQTVNTFISPFGNFSLAIPVTDPFDELFIKLIQLGII
ncbi:hypothetical protein [Mycolicibacterium sp. XJ870]